MQTETRPAAMIATNGNTAHAAILKALPALHPPERTPPYKPRETHAVMAYGPRTKKQGKKKEEEQDEEKKIGERRKKNEERSAKKEGGRRRRRRKEEGG